MVRNVKEVIIDMLICNAILHTKGVTVFHDWESDDNKQLDSNLLRLC